MIIVILNILYINRYKPQLARIDVQQKVTMKKIHLYLDYKIASENNYKITRIDSAIVNFILWQNKIFLFILFNIS